MTVYRLVYDSMARQDFYIYRFQVGGQIEDCELCIKIARLFRPTLDASRLAKPPKIPSTFKQKKQHRRPSANPSFAPPGT